MAKDKKVQILIDEVGSAQALADELGVTVGYVRQWLYKVQKVPPKLVTTLVKLSNGKVKAEDLRPDIFK